MTKFCYSDKNQPSDAMAKKYRIWRDTAGTVLCRWNSAMHGKTYPSISLVHIDPLVIDALAEHCLLLMMGNKIPCQTEYKTHSGDSYRAHDPHYHDSPWFDHVFLKWPTYPSLFPASTNSCLHWPFDIRRHYRILFPESEAETYPCIVPGLHAVIQSHVVAPNTRRFPKNSVDNCSILKHYNLSRLTDSTDPILYVVHVNTFRAPTICAADCSLEYRQYTREADTPADWRFFFMQIRHKDWGSTWHAFIQAKYTKATRADGAEEWLQGDFPSWSSRKWWRMGARYGVVWITVRVPSQTN